MLDLITLVAAVNIQGELDAASAQRKESVGSLVVHEHDSAQAENNLVEDAADQLSSAFDAFESVLGSFFGGSGSPASPTTVSPEASSKLVAAQPLLGAKKCA
eukprot:TRINITY_DN59975_c0_g1_i1.p1 TRINITY_DN59975_c0_g1~~TRINITY_DN59975_c0_g1_i1.p1  ORF type:complete len:102 (-),score=29.57 TRINITY_DN59975_c0_g1_i1:143-448(-)